MGVVCLCQLCNASVSVDKHKYEMMQLQCKMLLLVLCEDL